MKWMIGAGVAAAITASGAQAGPVVTLKLTGKVYYLTADMKPFFSLGEQTTAWFSYDASSAGEAWYPGGVLDPTVFFYRNAPSAGGGLQVGAYLVTFDQHARMFVTNQEPSSHGPIDRVLFDDFGAMAAPVAGRPLDVVSISFQDDTARALDSLALPSSGATYAAFPGARASLDWNPYLGAEHRISIDFTTVEAAVPEPAAWTMAISGFAVLGAMSRRRRAGGSSRAGPTHPHAITPPSAT